jgi:hypothetical protein
MMHKSKEGKNEFGGYSSYLKDANAMISGFIEEVSEESNLQS